MIKIEFATTNAAFDDCAELEIARILRRIADMIEHDSHDGGPIVDANGNTVGKWTWELTPTIRPCHFRFDYPETVYEGFAHGSTWNGFDNVAVTAETLARIIADIGADSEESAQAFRDLTPMDDGLYSLGWGFATQIVRDDSPIEGFSVAQANVCIDRMIRECSDTVEHPGQMTREEAILFLRAMENESLDEYCRLAMEDTRD